MSTNCRLDSPTAVIMPEGAGEPLEKPRGPGGAPRLCDHGGTWGPRLALTEEGAEHSPQDGVRERSKEGREFANGAQDQHDARTVLYHAPAAHLPGSQGQG